MAPARALGRVSMAATLASCRRSVTLAYTSTQLVTKNSGESHGHRNHPGQFRPKKKRAALGALTECT
jgi:hypothetical protein